MIDEFIIRKRRRVAPLEEAGGGWKIALADFMCALMITFFALWAIGQQDEADTSLLADYFRGDSLQQEQKMALLDTTFNEVEKILSDQGIVVTLTKNSKGIVIKFDSESLFESGSSDLKENAKKALITLSRETKHTNLFYHVYGYTDNVPVRKGSRIQNNLILSIMRATSAADAIFEGGVRDNKVTIHGEGSLNPESEEKTSAGNKMNRRVELYMSYTSAPHKIYGKSISYTKIKN